MVLYGGTGLVATQKLSSLSSEQGYVLTGASYSYTGCSVAGAGDVNDDGYDDILVGSNPGKNSVLMQSYVVFGSSNKGVSASILSLSDSQVMKLSGGGKIIVAESGSIVTVSQLPVSSTGYIVFANATELKRISAVPTMVPSGLPMRTPTSSPVTRQPSIRPSRKPSSLPSFRPSIPTSAPILGVESSEIPTADPSEPPSEYPSEMPSDSPTACPSFTPSVLPSVLPSMIPSPGPSVAPSVATTSDRSSFPASRRPFSIPTAAPTNSTTEMEMFISSGMTVGNQGKGGMKYTIATAEDVSIENRNGNNTYILLPFPGGLLVIQYFNNSNDLIDLTAFPSILSFSALIVSAGSVVVTLPNEQVVRIMNIHPEDVNGTSFKFYQDAGVTDKLDQRISVFVGIGIAFGGALAALFLISQCGPLVVEKVRKKVKAKDPPTWLFNIVEGDEAEQSEASVEAEVSRQSSVSFELDSPKSCDYCESPNLSEISINSDGEFVNKQNMV